MTPEAPKAGRRGSPA